MKVIKFAKNSTDIRIAYNNGRAVASIVKLPTNQYRVVKMYDGFVWDCDSYSEARDIALNAPTTLPKIAAPITANIEAAQYA